MFGPTDMVSLYKGATTSFERMALQALLGGTPATNATAYSQFKPHKFRNGAKSANPILHGGQDPLVPVVQSNTLKAKLESFNVPVQLFIYPNEGHGWFGTSLTDSYAKIQAFLPHITHNRRRSFLSPNNFSRF
jgi:dipeptidyl aminopeptidase/acylaminoacyl peptidase